MYKIASGFVAALRDTAPFLPELPQADAFEVLEQVRQYEREIALPVGTQPRNILIRDYAEGSAHEDDELQIYNPDTLGVLSSADHATDPVRKATGVREGADYGTGGLVRLLAERDYTTGIVPLGKQTGNAAVTPNHPLKMAMDTLLPNRPGFLSVHGMKSGKLEQLDDPTEIHAIIGLGKTPSEQTRQVAEKLIVAAKDLGLRAVIGNDVRFKTYDSKSGGLERNPQTGEPTRNRLAALGAGSTTNHAYKIMAAIGKQIPAFQLEMTRLLRLNPSDFEDGWHKDEKARAMGVYTGYLLVQAAVDLIIQAKK